MTCTSCFTDKHENCNHSPIAVQQKGEHLIVDIHAHINSMTGDSIMSDLYPNKPKGLPFSCPASDQVNAKMFKEIGPKLNGIDIRLAEMDSLGIDVQVLSPNPGQYYYFTPPEVGIKLSRAINNELAEAVSKEPARFVGVGTVPLQNVELAIAEMKRCVRELNFRGIEIGTNVNGKELADPSFRPFLQAAEDMGVLLFVHPLGFTHGDRLSEHYFNNLIGNPLESTIAISHLIFGGVLDRYPSLKMCIAHGGGYLPKYWGRMDHAYLHRDDCSEHITRKPSEYLKQLWFDSLVFDKRELDELINLYGAEKICLGTDYPFDMAEPDPVNFLAHLDESERAFVLGKNAASLLGLVGKRD